MGNDNKGKFGSHFGFLMASIGSAVGLGNLWGFPYKMGVGGGFAFLLLYVVLVIFVGYPLMIGEIALGRKSDKAAIRAYKSVNPKFTAAGWFCCIAPFLLLCFYATFGGYVIRYLLANLGDLFNLSFGIGGSDSANFFNNFVGSGLQAMFYGWVFLGVTVFIVVRGIKDGIEGFNKFAMPALFVMLLIVVIRSCTLPGASKGLAFIFKPDFSVFKGWGWLKVLGLAGSQMFFSLSLASGAIIAYGSYMNKDDDIEQSSLIIPFADTLAALLAAMAVMPAVFAFGLEPSGGPGLLFVSLQTVFSNMGSSGPLFGSLFYLLVLFAAVSSSIAMMEGGVSSMMDADIFKNTKNKRLKVTLIMALIGFVGSGLVSYDALGSSGLFHPFGQSSWLDVFDLMAEGLFMPLSGFMMTILLGWIEPDYVDDELALSGSFKTRPFYRFSMKYLATIFLFFILLVQLNQFFHFI